MILQVLAGCFVNGIKALKKRLTEIVSRVFPIVNLYILSSNSYIKTCIKEATS